MYDINTREVRLEPGESRDEVDLPVDLVKELEKNDETKAQDMRGQRATVNGVRPPNPLPAHLTGKPAVELTGMNGIGDCIHQRAAVRELMKTHDVWLRTCHFEMYRDLVEQGLNLVFQPTSLHAQALTIERERAHFPHAPRVPITAQRVKVWYKKEGIDRYGSILKTILGVCNVNPERPDFSLPIRPEWREKARALISSWDTGGRAIMVYRPIVLRDREWRSGNRNPDHEAYAQLFAMARRGYFVVSVAHLVPGLETIVGPEQHADVKLHSGELDFQTMAALWAEAQLGFFNAGFGPVLAQAVGLPSIIVYGGRESYRTTQAAGAHLAPTLGIDTIKPCDCHTENHACEKRINVPVALRVVAEFAPRYLEPRDHTYSPLPVVLLPAPPETPRLAAPAASDPSAGGVPMVERTLIFGTVYCDCPDRQRLTEQWVELNAALNPQADLMLVDSASPYPLISKGRPELLARVEIVDLGDNIGHLSRGGRDGWGRAFSRGLELAMERGYATVAHVEGDSLLALPVSQLAADMRRVGKGVATTPVRGMTRDMPGWVETGLMVFDVRWLISSGFVGRYDWPNRKVTPTPEIIVGRLVHRDVHWLTLKALRNDKGEVTHENIGDHKDLKWLTHCHRDVWAYDRFFENGLRAAAQLPPPAASLPAGAVPLDTDTARVADLNPGAAPTIIAPTGLKLNLGCGTNKLAGWLNHDDDVDITKPLPWPDNSADYVFIEHCVEHVPYYSAIGFFEEAYRVLRPGGVLRVTVPSLEQIGGCRNEAYWKFAEKWGGSATRRGAMKAILYAHGHATAWTASLMRWTLDYVGFEYVEARQVGKSPHAALNGAEGHGSVIGDVFNAIESMPFEATKPGGTARVAAGQRVALVLGGSSRAEAELAAALAMTGEADVTVLAVNDWMGRYAHPCIGVTLHPEKLTGWVEERRAAALPKMTTVWGHKHSPGITDVTEDWSGSSGLFAAKVARQMGFRHVVLCGVPMDPEAGNMFRSEPKWQAAASFRRGWERHRSDISPIVRSMSGWTKTMFGAPDAAWLSS